jgi:hypothetical protein
LKDSDWKFLGMKFVRKGRKRSWDMKPWKRQSTSEKPRDLTRISPTKICRSLIEKETLDNIYLSEMCQCVCRMLMQPRRCHDEI